MKTSNSLLIALLLAPLNSHAQDADASYELQNVTVLGNRASPRTAIETAVPVDIITGDEIRSSGHTETARAIQALAPSFNFSTSTISDGTDTVRPATLRGLGPDQLLVLVNGRRRHNSALLHVNGSVGRGTAGTDLNAIPISAIDRIEILRDGAAAQYGSDAIAGVINLVLKSDADTVTVDLYGGQTYEGDGEQLNASANGGFSLPNAGFINFTLEHRDRGATNRAGLDPRQQYPLLPDGSEDPREDNFNRLNHRYGDADSENNYLWVNGSINASDQSELYFFGGISTREGESGGFYRRALDARNRPEVYPDGFLPLINTDVDDRSMVIGFRHPVGSWDMDASYAWGENTFGFFISNSINVSLGPDSPSSADAGELGFSQSTFNLDFTNSKDIGLPNPLGMALGFEYRQDSYSITPGAEASYVDGGFPDQFGNTAPVGIQVFPGFRPSNAVDQDRDNIAVYGEFSTDLSINSSLSLALRYEDYSDFGNTFDGKLSGRHAFNDYVAIRGSLSSGFRAPSLHQRYFNNTSTQFIFNDDTGQLEPTDVGTFANDSALVQALGVPSLTEETSRNFSLGLVAEPNSEWTLSADLYRIDIDDRVVLSGMFGGFLNPDIADILEPFGVNSAQFFTNAVDTETTGLDIVTAWERDYDDYRLRFTGAANWTDTDVVGTVKTPPALADFGEVLFNRIERERLESAQPDSVINLSGQYERGPFQLTLRTIRYGEVKVVESASDPSRDQVFGAKWVTDLDLRWRFNDRWSASIGANNLFDVYPDRNSDANSFNGIFPYPRRAAPFGFNGGFYYARINFQGG
ncbi:MAG: ligand-gated channel [Lysobacteraceae bacterium]|nr:MAG: ligand-gated channel [Xanthomonadaceae bacterium]